MKNEWCKYYPCHDMKDMDCTCCYCPEYPCVLATRGKLLWNGLWDCSMCTRPHTVAYVDKAKKKWYKGLNEQT